MKVDRKNTQAQKVVDRRSIDWRTRFRKLPRVSDGHYYDDDIESFIEKELDKAYKKGKKDSIEDVRRHLLDKHRDLTNK